MWKGQGRYPDYPMYDEWCCDVATFYHCYGLADLQFYCPRLVLSEIASPCAMLK